MHNTRLFKKKKILAFVFKINTSSLCEAVLQYYLLISILNDLPDVVSGKTMNQITL